MLLTDSLLLLATLGDNISKDIVVVTGQGHGSGSDGPVLQSVVPHFLLERLGLETTPVSGNPGRFVLEQRVLHESKKLNADSIRQLQSVLHKDVASWTSKDHAVLNSFF
jgi:hypothetical protein